MSRKALYVLGAGGHGRVVAEAAREGGAYEVRGFLDDDPALWGSACGDLPVAGGTDALRALEAGAEVALGIGANQARARAAASLAMAGVRLATIVHPSAVLARGARLGKGTYVAPLCVIHSDARVGCGCIVNTAAVVEHDCRLDDWAHLSPRAILGGGASLGEGAHVGLGAVVLPGLALGSWATLGAGAVMTRCIPPGVTAVGVPARALSERLVAPGGL